jgi:hypothetical protein
VRMASLSPRSIPNEQPPFGKRMMKVVFSVNDLQACVARLEPVALGSTDRHSGLPSSCDSNERPSTPLQRRRSRPVQRSPSRSRMGQRAALAPARGSPHIQRAPARIEVPGSWCFSRREHRRRRQSVIHSPTEKKRAAPLREPLQRRLGEEA